jgi:thioredoxin reductase
MRQTIFDVIIIGGSYSGLAAGMALGRALTKVLIIDDGNPCNAQTPYSHNFLTNDGNTPAQIAALGKEQVKVYRTVEFFDGKAMHAKRIAEGFEVTTISKNTFRGINLVFATGIKDLLPAIPGLAESWGISVLHCPYCHGYEVVDRVTGILGNGEPAFDFTRLISNWTSTLTLFTNGISTLTADHRKKLATHAIEIVEKEITGVEHQKGYVRRIFFKDGTYHFVHVIYAPSPFEQHCKIPEELGCELTEEGYIKTDGLHATTVSNVYAIGDNASKMRTVANAVANGTSAGLIISKKLILGQF